MPRTLDPVAHATRRDVFLDAAQELFQAKGYEGTSIQDVLDTASTSKGALYHYFDSKGALLDGVIERMVDGAMISIEPIVADPDLPALEKLRGIFGGIASYKSARRELLLAISRVWLSDENAVVRERFRRAAGARITPVLAAVIRQGHNEGAFDVREPDDTARVLVSLLLATNLAASELFLRHQAEPFPFAEVARFFGAYADAFDRILGARPGALPLVDEAVLHEWFDEGTRKDPP